MVVLCVLRLKSNHMEGQEALKAFGPSKLLQWMEKNIPFALLKKAKLNDTKLQRDYSAFLKLQVLKKQRYR